MHPDALAPGARLPDVDHLAWLEQYVRPPGVLHAGSWQGAHILDLGCGSGFLCAELRRQGAAHVVGVDLLPPDQEVRDWTFLTLDLDRADWDEQLPRLAGAAFDLISAFDILEHLSSPWHFLKACSRLLAPGGRLLLTTPNTASWERLLRPLRWSGATDPQHKTLFSRYSLAFIMERAGYQVQTLKAPVRSLVRRGIPCPQIGAQILCVASQRS